jgi:arsenate reductase
MIQIYHNPRCGKSRECLSFLKDSNKEFEVISYLENPPTFEELTEILKKLNFKPIQLVRVKEKIWIENYKGKDLNDSQIIEAMVSNPILIERPIVITKDKAIVARPLEKVNEIL